MVAHAVWDRKVAGSSPVAPSWKKTGQVDFKKGDIQMENQIKRRDKNTLSCQDVRSKLEGLLRECNSEGEFREACKQAFEGFSSVYVSWWPGIRIANLYIQGHEGAINAAVNV